VDAGVGPRVVAARLAAVGVTLARGDLHGILASHHHGDHFGEIERLAQVYECPVYLHQGIDARRLRERIEIRTYDVGRAFRIEALSVEAVLVPHDAPQVALRVDDGGCAIGIATDVGRVTPALVGLLAGCDAALVEANHCSEMLAFGSYPERIKRRIGGGYGHLSNGQTADLAARLVGSRMARLWLGHLSSENNTPERALEVVGSAARRIDVEVLPQASPCALDVRHRRPYQLALAFSARESCR
jgi:phosphoribosyl 1,2-cyclic phosphodiesterase